MYFVIWLTGNFYLWLQGTSMCGFGPPASATLLVLLLFAHIYDDGSASWWAAGWMSSAQWGWALADHY